MTLPLETQIMREIGFDQHYTYENGSGSVPGRRRKATELLPQRIDAHNSETPDEISEAYDPLMATFKDIGTAESDAYRRFEKHYSDQAKFNDRVEEVGSDKAVAEREAMERQLPAFVREEKQHGRPGDNVLTNTWIASSYIIAEHINVTGLPDAEREAKLDALDLQLKLEYVTKERILDSLMHTSGDQVNPREMLQLGQQIKSATSLDELKGYLDAFSEKLPEGHHRLMRYGLCDEMRL